ncbi:O177 family O-antigen flippase [Shigella flexneri]|nr:O177 family O-antigen flippase [Escherichia coli]
MLTKNTLIRNSILNLSGYIIPTLAAIPALGYMARELGAELFGIYTLAMALVGYASVFDFGLTRAIIREIAVYRDDIVEKRKIISTSTVFLTVIGFVVTALIFINVNTIVTFINVSKNNFEDANIALKILSLSIPLLLLNQLWASVFEGEEKFGLINIQKTMSNTCIVALPAVCIMKESSLTYAVSGLVVGRVISLILSFWFLRKEIVASGIIFHTIVMKRLIMFGSWMTFSNIISPMMVYFDRFIISNILGAKNVGFYTAPAEIISRMSIIPTSVSRALFPRLSNMGDIKKFKYELLFSYAIMISICAPIVLFLLLFSGKIMYYWLGAQYFLKSSIIFSVLLIGFFFNSLAQLPFSAIQSLGNSKITALLHGFEIIPYLIILYILTSHFGIVGTAYAWTLRVMFDFIALYFLSSWLIKKKH